MSSLQVIGLTLTVNLITALLLFFIIRQSFSKWLTSTRVSYQLERENEELITRLNQATERNMLLLEDKITILKDLLDKSEQKIRLLNREEQNKERFNNYNQLRQHAAVTQQGDNVNNTNPIRENVVSLSNGSSQQNHAEISSREKKREKIKELYLLGMKNSDIAANLAAPLSEIEFVVSLISREREN